jgi:hypothetical protein
MAERTRTRPRERLVTALETGLVGPYADLEVRGMVCPLRC